MCVFEFHVRSEKTNDLLCPQSYEPTKVLGNFAVSRNFDVSRLGIGYVIGVKIKVTKRNIFVHET
jgi:hypothetical protein